MKTGWFVAIAAVFYLFVVVLFWPIEKQLVKVNGSTVDRAGYGRATVIFSDTSVRALVPTTTALSQLGLGGRTELSDGEGMLWVFAPAARPAFWMHGMVVPLDFIWIQRNQIVDLTTDVPPPADPTSTDIPQYEPTVPVDHVLEVAAGFAARHNVHVGDLVQIDK